MMRPMTNPATESAHRGPRRHRWRTAGAPQGARPVAPAPRCVRESLLADFGADVLRIEQPGGTDPLRYDRAMNVAYNRGKRSMTLDLRHERAGDVLRRLVRNVDVVIESARPGLDGAARHRLRRSLGREPGPGLVLDHRLRARQPLRRSPRPRRDVPRLRGAALADGGRHRACRAAVRHRGPDRCVDGNGRDPRRVADA